MAFGDIESSIDEGRPVRLYAFMLGDKTWRYTSADKDITAGGHLWTAKAMKDSGVRSTGDASSDALTIEAESTVAPAQMFMTTPPSRSIQVTILEKHDGAADTIATYAGEVTQVSFPMPGVCRITCETISASLRRQGLRLGYQRQCPYALYDPLTCKAPKEPNGTPFIVMNVVGNDVVMLDLAGKADGFFDTGFIEFQHPAKGLEFRAIEVHKGLVLTMFGGTDDIFPGMTGTAYRGCQFTPASCKSFNNYPNYGGFEDMPGKSPFDGNPVF